MRFLFAIALALAGLSHAETPVPSPFDLKANAIDGPLISWFGRSGRYYDLWSSEDLATWAPVDGFPIAGVGNQMEIRMLPAPQGFFRMASAGSATTFLLPEVRAYQIATGISADAANEINLFLRYLRGAGVEPLIFWVGGSRYKSIEGNTVRAVIGGNGTLNGTLGPRDERSETFTATQSIRFSNPLKNSSQTRVGFFAGAAPSSESGTGVLIGGGDTSPLGPRLSAAYGGGTFLVYNSAGTNIPHPGYGGFVKAGTFMPYIGGAYDGAYSVLCGIGKSSGSRANPLQFTFMSPTDFPNGTFYNSQDFIEFGAPNFSGKLYFGVVTAADLTDNKRSYTLSSIPRRSGWGPYGVGTAVVFLGDSIILWSNDHIWDSTGRNPPHKGGGQWNRNCVSLLANATGEGNDAQIEYYEKGARLALDAQTWDNLFYVCASGGHYPYSADALENPLSADAKVRMDQWIQEYQEKIAIPAAIQGATVVQMTYIYGCPQKLNPPKDPEAFRAMVDYFTTKQREVAQSAGFTIFDVYQIPQLHEPLPAFYADSIHPSPAGCRLIAQEFAASVANPASRIPRSLTRPAITGSPSTGSLLSCSKGTWAFTPTAFTYQWMRDATDITGAISSSYTLEAADIGYHLSCRITATNSYGSAERTSAHTPQVVP